MTIDFNKLADPKNMSGDKRAEEAFDNLVSEISASFGRTLPAAGALAKSTLRLAKASGVIQPRDIAMTFLSAAVLAVRLTTKAGFDGSTGRITTNPEDIDEATINELSMMLHCAFASIVVEDNCDCPNCTARREAGKNQG